jgi:hypothetical protein
MEDRKKNAGESDPALLSWEDKDYSPFKDSK